MSDPWANSVSGVTIPLSSEQTGPVITFSGPVSTVKSQVVEAFALGSEAGNLALHEVVLDAWSVLRAGGFAVESLGAKPIAGTEVADGVRVEESAPPVEKSGEASLSDLIAGASSMDELKQLWRGNKAAIQGDKGLLAAWKARGKEVK